MSANFSDPTLDDFLRQMEEIQRLGGFKEFIRKIPGLESLAVTIEDTEQDVRRITGIVHSMTPVERSDGSLMTPSRLQRIASGSGTTTAEVSKVVADFYRLRIQMRNWRSPQCFGD